MFVKVIAVVHMCCFSTFILSWGVMKPVFGAFVPSVVIMGEVELSCRAYVKMFLHSSLFPRCSINGLLLSSTSAGGAVCVTDCVPLLHSHLPLAPITQLALTQVGHLQTDRRPTEKGDFTACFTFRPHWTRSRSKTTTLRLVKSGLERPETL